MDGVNVLAAVILLAVIAFIAYMCYAAAHPPSPTGTSVGDIPTGSTTANAPSSTTTTPPSQDIVDKLVGVINTLSTKSQQVNTSPQVVEVVAPRVRCAHHACDIQQCGCHTVAHSMGIGQGFAAGYVPVPTGAFKNSNVEYGSVNDWWRDQYYTSGMGGGRCNCGCNSLRPCKNYRRLPGLREPQADNFFTPYSGVGVGPLHSVGGGIASTSAYAPFPEVESCWEKIGVLTSNMSDDTPNAPKNLLNLYRRPIAPSQNLWEYQVQDQSNFVLKLNDREIRDGDIVTVPGKQGTWTAKVYLNNKWIWQRS